MSGILENLTAANQKLVVQLKWTNEQFTSLKEAHEKFKSTTEVKEKNWKIEKYETSQQMIGLGDMVERLKEEKFKVEEELKIKSRLFKQLEENYEMLRDRLDVKEKQWGIEKGGFLDEISKLERKLELSEDVKNRLENCEQALAREEKQRSCLESQLLESKSCNEDIKSKLERLTIEKDGVCKEMECKILQIEEEKKELVLAVKKHKESEIREAVNSSLIIENYQKKFNTLVEINKDKEAEWTSRLEKLVEEKSELRNVCERLDTAKEELVKRGNEVEIELQRWKSIAEKLQVEKEGVTNEKDQMINKLLTEKEKLMNMMDDMVQWIDKLAGEEREMMEEFSAGFR